MTRPSSASGLVVCVGRPASVGCSTVVLSALMSPPRPRRNREDDQEGPSQHHPPGRVEAPEVGGAAGLGPEVVPAPLVALGGIDLVFTIRTGEVLIFEPSIGGGRGGGFSRGEKWGFSWGVGGGPSEGEGGGVGAGWKEAVFHLWAPPGAWVRPR